MGEFETVMQTLTCDHAPSPLYSRRDIPSPRRQKEKKRLIAGYANPRRSTRFA